MIGESNQRGISGQKDMKRGTHYHKNTNTHNSLSFPSSLQESGHKGATEHKGMSRCNGKDRCKWVQGLKCLQESKLAQGCKSHKGTIGHSVHIYNTPIIIYAPYSLSKSEQRWAWDPIHSLALTYTLNQQSLFCLPMPIWTLVPTHALLPVCALAPACIFMIPCPLGLTCTLLLTCTLAPTQCPPKCICTLAPTHTLMPLYHIIVKSLVVFSLKLYIKDAYCVRFMTLSCVVLKWHDWLHYRSKNFWFVVSICMILNPVSGLHFWNIYVNDTALTPLVISNPCKL